MKIIGQTYNGLLVEVDKGEFDLLTGDRLVNHHNLIGCSYEVHKNWNGIKETQNRKEVLAKMAKQLHATATMIETINEAFTNPVQEGNLS